MLLLALVEAADGNSTLVSRLDPEKRLSLIGKIARVRGDTPAFNFSITLRTANFSNYFRRYSKPGWKRAGSHSAMKACRQRIWRSVSRTPLSIKSNISC